MEKGGSYLKNLHSYFLKNLHCYFLFFMHSYFPKNLHCYFPFTKGLLQGLGELMDEQMKKFIQRKMRSEVIELLKIFKAFPIQ